MLGRAGGRREHHVHLRARWNAVVGADAADRRHDGAHFLELPLPLREALVDLRPRRRREQLIVAPPGEPLPERFGDERHDRMEQPQRTVEHVHEHGARDIAIGGRFSAGGPSIASTYQSASSFHTKRRATSAYSSSRMPESFRSVGPFAARFAAEDEPGRAPRPLRDRIVQPAEDPAVGTR